MIRFALRSACVCFCVLGLQLASASDRGNGETPDTFLADLSPELRAALAELKEPPVGQLDPLAQLEAVFAASSPYLFQAGVLSVQTDNRWFSTRPEGGAGSAVLELRRWPGDTVLTLYSVEGPAGDGDPPVHGAEFELTEQVEGSHAIWEGPFETEAGDRPAYWVEVVVPESESHLGALLLPGDAGLGERAIADLFLELRVVLGRVEINLDAWIDAQPTPAGVNVIPPETGGTPGDKLEENEPWQVTQATEFTMGLPPGFRARRMDAGVPSPTAIPGGRLWFRGRFMDQSETQVIVGDGQRTGYVARIDDVKQAWTRGKQAPLGAPNATRVRSEAYPLAAERASAAAATAERWKEQGFAGDWLVFRLVFGNAGFEIGLPVVSGRRSASLFWIPVTWRSADEAPAPPPVDPAERFGIRFEQLGPSDRKRLPWLEGYLKAPGLRAELPLGWFPAASLRSRDGYPVRFVNRSGKTHGTLTRLDPGKEPAVADEASGWVRGEHAGRHRASAIWSTSDGRHLLVANEGHSFLLEPALPLTPADADAWKLLIESVRLQRSSSQPK